MLSACWRKELPNAGETDFEMMYIHLSNGRMHVVVGDCDKYSKEEMIRVVRRVEKAGPCCSNRPKDLLLNIDLMLAWYNKPCKTVDGQRKEWRKSVIFYEKMSIRKPRKMRIFRGF